GNNAAYQQTLQAPAPLTMAPGVQLDGSLARDIAAASQTLARCEAKLKAGKAKHCDGDRARLTALESAQAGQLQAQTQAGIAATEAQAKANLEALKLNHARQDQLKAESYNPVIVMMAKAIGGLAGTDWTGHVKVAVVLVMLIVAVSFEILHHFLSHAKERADQAVIGLALELARLEGETGPSAPAAEKTVEPVNPPNRPMGFNWQPTPAPAAATGRIETPPPAPVRFKYQQNPVPPAAEHRTPGFIGFWDTSQVAAPAPVPAPAARSTGNREWQQAGIPAPADRALDRASHPKAGTHEHQLAMPLEALSKPSADGPVETLSKPSADGPVETLSKSSADGPVETLSKPSADGPVETLSKPSADGPVETLSKPSADGLTSLYGMWVSAVQAGECKPSVRESWGWIQKRISARETGSRTHDRTRISNLQKAFFAKAMHEGLMTLNPAYRNGGKKYLWRA
ncbi:MAG: hypothetical protein KDI15_01185, partial [Thiothrix sp.]|nr:hypothetical protein [Thiothrix sp.]